jgi:hypothetical protein
MKSGWAALWILSVAIAFGVGRGTAPVAPVATLAPASFHEALSDWDPLTRPFRISAYLQDFGPEQLPEALAALEELQIGVTPEEVRLLMHAWARFDAPGAFAWASEWPTPWRKTLMAEALHAWGYQDGPAAMQVVEALEDEELRGRFRPSTMDGWIRSEDQTGLVAEISSRQEPQIRRRLTFVLVGEQRKRGVEVMQRFVEAVPDDTPNYFKRNAFYHASVSLAREDPQAAAGWLAKHADHSFSLDAAPGIARKWAERDDPAALFVWARALPAADEERRKDRDEAIGEGFRIWRRRAPDQAEAWLVGALPDPLLDPAVAEMATALAQKTPSEAIEWAIRIKDPTMQRRKLQLAGRLWARADPEAAEAWLAEHEVPDALRRQMLNVRPSLVKGEGLASPQPSPSAQ